MAATLVYIKSKRLVPKHEVEEEEELDPEVVLIERLKAYKIFKEASAKMKKYEVDACNKFYKLPMEYPFEIDDLSVEGATITKLCKAYERIMKRVDLRETEQTYHEVTFHTDAVTVKQRKKYIREILNEKGKVSFDMLFDDVRSRLDVAVTFLALLELLHIAFLMVEQKRNLDIIIITKA